jgi:hypothetical protein
MEKEGISMKPIDLILRCYGYRKGNKWIGVCVDLDIAAEADSLDDLKNKLNSMIHSYVETVCDTEDKSSIPYLIKRRSPLPDWFRYYLTVALCRIANRKRDDRRAFDEMLPFHIAHSC